MSDGADREAPRFARTVAFRGRDAAQVVDRVTRSASQHSVLLRSPSLHGSMTFSVVGAVNLVYVRYGADVLLEVPATPGRTTITVPFAPMRTSGTGARARDRRVETAAFVVDQHDAMRMQPDPDAGALVISTATDVVNRHFAALMRGQLGVEPLRFLPPAEPGAPAPAPSLLPHAWRLAQEAARIGVRSTFEGEVERFLLDAFVFSVPHSQSSRLLQGGEQPRPDLAEAARQYIDDHHRGPLSVAEVAHAVGASIRQLQYVLGRRFGCTPRELLLRIRLEHAHELILRSADLPPEHRPTIASIALEAGFTHLGRFAAAYRDRYGRSPSTAQHEVPALRP